MQIFKPILFDFKFVKLYEGIFHFHVTDEPTVINIIISNDYVIQGSSDIDFYAYWFNCYSLLNYNSVYFTKNIWKSGICPYYSRMPEFQLYVYVNF